MPTPLILSSKMKRWENKACPRGKGRACFLHLQGSGGKQKERAGGVGRGRNKTSRAAAAAPVMPLQPCAFAPLFLAPGRTEEGRDAVPSWAAPRSAPLGWGEPAGSRAP